MREEPSATGIIAVVNREFPGSSRSGEYARKKSVPEHRPVAFRIGLSGARLMAHIAGSRLPPVYATM